MYGPSWPSPAHPGSGSNHENHFPTGDHEIFTTYSWEDQKVRRVFIRKVTTSPNSPGPGARRESPSRSPSLALYLQRPPLSTSLLTPADRSCWETLPQLSPCPVLCPNPPSPLQIPWAPFPGGVGVFALFLPYLGAIPMTCRRRVKGTGCGSGG